MHALFSISTQRATHRIAGDEVRARGKDFSCFSGFGAGSASQSLSPPRRGQNPISP
jgi:hypothetical protein